MSQQWPRVRNACEACHKRKQRCILPDSGGCCQACQQTGRQCYFLPRYRPGRPQRRPTDGVDDASGSAQASGSSTVASPPLPRLATPALPLDAGVSMSYTSTVEAAMTELDMYRESLNNAGGDNGTTFAYEHMPHLPQGLGDQVFDDAFYTEQIRAFPDLGTNTNTTPPAPTTAATLAKHFISLDDHRETLLSVTFGVQGIRDLHARIEPTLSTIADTCPLALGLLSGGSPPRDGSVGAIVTATMMKILEMCDIIVKLAETHLGVTPASTPISSPLLLEEVTSIRPPLHARSRSGHGSVTSENSWHSGTFSSPEVQQSVDIINFVVALKQLEVSLSQAKICLSVFGQDKAAQVTYSLMEQSAGLHDRINVLIESTCG